MLCAPFLDAKKNYSTRKETFRFCSVRAFFWCLKLENKCFILLLYISCAVIVHKLFRLVFVA